MIGKTISHYRIIEKLGEGGMGIVYLAQDLKLGRRVALKLLPQERTSSPEARARFIHEAQAAASLNHANICTVHEIDEVNGLVFLAMEHIEGESLAQKISRGPLKIADAVRICMAIAEGLRAAHSRGVVHRDIKPGNVMVARYGHTKVLDFGLALVPEMTRLTQEGRTTGTVSYMSPEQSRGDSVDSRTDIWSLGVVLYEMLTGKRPFAGSHEQAVLRSIINDEPEAPSGLRTGVPLELERIALKAMAKDRADRYQHVDDMIVDLRAVERSTTSGAVAPIAPTAETAPPRVSKSRWLRMATGPVVVAVVVIAAAWIYSATRRNQPTATAPPARDVVVVAGFENRSGDPSLDYMSASLVTALSEGLGLTGVVDVVPGPPDAARAASETDRLAGDTQGRLLQSARYIGASVLVTGSFHARGDSLHVEARVLQVSDGKAINVFPDEVCSLATPSAAIDRVRSRVMGSLAARADPTLGPDSSFYAPTYEAYKEFEVGMREFGIRGEAALVHFNRAHELDPDFAYVDIFRVGTLVALGRFAEADSLSRNLRPRLSTLAPRLSLYLDVFSARLRGDEEASLRSMREIVRIAPHDFMAWRMLCVFALRLNRPKEAIASLEQLMADIPETDLYIESWTYSGLATAYHMLGEYERELSVVEEAVERFPGTLLLRTYQMQPLAALGRIEDIERVVEESAASSPGNSSMGAVLHMAAVELRAHGHPKEAATFADRAVQWRQRDLESGGATKRNRDDLAMALYQAERWDEARELFTELSHDYPEDFHYRGYLGTLAARSGETARAEAIKDSLLAIDEPYDFGMNVYWAACISAQLGQKEEAMEYLRRSYSEGAGLGLHVHRDLDLEPLWEYPPFRRFIEPRG